MMKRIKKTKKSRSVKSRGFVHSEKTHFNQDEWNQELSDYLKFDENIRDKKLFSGEQL